MARGAEGPHRRGQDGRHRDDGILRAAQEVARRTECRSQRKTRMDNAGRPTCRSVKIAMDVSVGAAVSAALFLSRFRPSTLNRRINEIDRSLDAPLLHHRPKAISG